MKKDWEIKKLGEVCEIVGGSTPKTSEESFWSGKHYWISPAELDGSKYVYSTSRRITDEGVKSAHLQLLPIGTVLLSSRAPIGKVAITKVPMYCNQGFKNLICSDSLHNEYAYWFLYHNTEYLNSLGTGATFKEISKRIVEQIPIPVPPLSIQERIVEELDCLSGIIDKKKQQLKELDALAQSTFYEMFGDPITNDKGWEVAPLNDTADFYNGVAHEGAVSEDGIYDIVNSKFISTQGGVRKHCEQQMFPLITNDIVMVMSDVPNGKALAKCYLIETNNKYTLNQRICAFRNYNLVPLYLYYYLNRHPYYLSFDNGNGQTNLRKNDVLNCPVHLPPLPLQQSFAKKVEAIEKQKELIKRSIGEVETLFNARMQEYFG